MKVANFRLAVEAAPQHIEGLLANDGCQMGGEDTDRALLMTKRTSAHHNTYHHTRLRKILWDMPSSLPGNTTARRGTDSRVMQRCR